MAKTQTPALNQAETAQRAELLAWLTPCAEGILPEHYETSPTRRLSIGMMRSAIALIDAWGERVRDPQWVEYGSMLPAFTAEASSYKLREGYTSQPVPLDLVKALYLRLSNVGVVPVPSAPAPSEGT